VTLDPAVRDLLVAIRGALEANAHNRFHVRSAVETLLLQDQVGTADLAWATRYLTDGCPGKFERQEAKR
jgi:hypothetical protein